MKPLFILDRHCDANPQSLLATPITELVETWKISHGNYALLHQDVIRSSNKSLTEEIDAVLEQDGEIDFIVTHWTLTEYARLNQIEPPTRYFRYLKNSRSIPMVFVAYDSVAPDVTRQILNLSGAISLLVTLDAEASEPVRRALNGNCVHLWTPQHAALFQPRFEPFEKRDISILFLGTPTTPERQRWLPILQAHFGDKIQLAGGRSGGKFLDQAEYLKMHRRAKIVVNFAQSLGGPDQLKGRVFESAYSGAAIFSNGSELVGRFFEPNTEFIPFFDVRDLIRSIEDGLANEARLERVAKRAWEKAWNVYTSGAFWDRVLGALAKVGQSSAPALDIGAAGGSAAETPLGDNRSLSTDLFFSRDLVSTALTQDETSWQYFAAKGLIGSTRSAVEGLAHFTNSEARFCSGVASWIAGDEGQALKALEAVALPEARRLLELIRRPQIDVLTQVPPGSSQSVPDFAACAEDRFRIKNIACDGGSSLRHSRVLPGTDVREFLGDGFSPAFYLCREIEWMALPANLPLLGCPIFGHTEDYDIHLQAVLPQYALFDRVITCGSYEWNDLSRMLAVPVSTFPKAYGLRDGLPAFENDKRDIDFFISGTIFHPYHPDKARLVNGLLDRLDRRLNLKVISTHIPPEEYFNLLARTKICLPYVRFDGSMPTRGLEALAMGNALILQKGCSLSAYFGEEDGVFTCDYSSAELPALIERVSNNWAEIAPKAARGARRVREEFSMKRVSAEYLRFATVLAAISPQREKKPCLGAARRKRAVISVGWTHDSDYYLESLAAMARAFGEAEQFAPGAINDFAREILLFYATSADQKVVDKITRWGRWSVPVPEFLGKALDLMRGGVAMYPRFLALQFNLMRALHHFGGSQGEVRKMAEAIVASQKSDWDVGLLDDVLPYDFFPEHFNYRSYFDLTVKLLGEGREGAPGLFRLIRASAAHYASMAGGSIECARTAADLDPEFPLYRLDLAKRLATQNCRREAAQILAGLAGEDVIPLGAWDELEKLNLMSELPADAAQALSLRVGRIRARIAQQP